MTTFVAPIQNQWDRQIDSATGRFTPWKLAGTFTDNVPATVGTAAWVSANLPLLGNTDEGDQASWNGSNSASTFLYLSNFGLGIPASATILGIEVSVVTGSTWTSSVQETAVRLAMATNAATVSTDNKASGVARTPLAESIYGGPADLWGETTATLTPAVLNATSFGVVYRVNASAATQSATLRRLALRVTYSVVVDGAVRVTQEYAEVLVKTTEPVRVTQEYAEVLVKTTEPIRVTQVYAEVIRSIADSAQRLRRMIILQGSF